jgi:hypothetical protein
MKVELGVVEDRHDPKKMGRVRVRILGKHSPDLQEIPTESLPWATVMLPTTSPSVSGLGHTQFLVEGSWVVLAFNDSFLQDPIVLGSITGLPQMTGADVDMSQGFADIREPSKDPEEGLQPEDKFPRYKNDPDYNKLGRGIHSSKHWALKNRRANAVKFNEIDKSDQGEEKTVGVVSADGLAAAIDVDDVDTPTEGGAPIAVDPEMTATEASFEGDRTYWQEPMPGPTGGYSQYPYNHVYESESGHVIEIDDTPNSERLHTMHKSGTFEEIHADGTKVTKIVKDNYEIVLGNNNIYINGSCNLTVSGNMTQYIKGDYTLEVDGNYNQKIGKSKAMKIGGKGIGNYSYEVLGASTGYVQGNDVINNGGSNVITRGSHSHQTLLGMNLNAITTININSLLSTTLESAVSTKIACAAGMVKVGGNTVKINAATLMNIDCDAGSILTTAPAGGIISTAGLSQIISAGTSALVSAVGVVNVTAIETNIIGTGLVEVLGGGNINVATAGIVSVNGSLINLN